MANAGAVEGLQAPIAMVCLAAVIGGLTTFLFLRLKRHIVNQIPTESSPRLGGERPRSSQSLGDMECPADTAFGREYHADYLRYLEELKDY